MPVKITKPQQNLIEELASLKARVRGSEQEVFWSSGDGSNTAFSLVRGWKPKFVYVDGALYREGASEDYTVSYDGFIYTVVMAVAPAAVDVGIIAQRDI